MHRKIPSIGKKVLIVTCALPLALALYVSSHAWPIPDTGLTKCYNNTGEIPCAQPGQPFYGQDGNYTINPPSYTKLDANGNALPPSATEWVMVRDNVIGLIWENKTSDGSIHEGSKTFTWCDTNPATNGGYQGNCGAGVGDAATDTEAFIKALNHANFGGFSDWRVPTRKELRTIVDYGRFNPAINTTDFSNTQASYYWSSTTYVGDTGYAWSMDFDFGHGPYGDKSRLFYVRAVRGGQAENRFTDNGDGTVTDNSTGIMWQQAIAPGTYTWEQALSYCENLTLAGYTDWRLPTISELDSIVDLSRDSPAINSNYFPGDAASIHWSSTTDVQRTNGAWVMLFYYGNDFADYYWRLYYVRAVRRGQAAELGDLDGDGSINLTDAILGLRITAGFKSPDINARADVNGDAKIGMTDVVYILQKTAGLR